MIIVIDTTALVSDPLCDGLWAQDIYLNADLALDDDAETYAERLEQALEAAEVRIASVPDVPHMEVVRRATERRKPCDGNGDGYRDTLNWLLVLSVARNEPEEDIIWVSGNTKDFADDESGDLHEDLRAEAELAGVSAKLRWHPSLGDAVLQVAQTFTPDTSDLRELQKRLREETVLGYLTGSVLPSLYGTSVEPRDCALPVTTVGASISALANPRDLEWTPRGSLEDGGAIIEFEVAVDATVVLTFEGSYPEDDEVITLVSTSDQEFTCLLAKSLRVRGLLTVDRFDRPQEGEVTKVLAPEGDPGRFAWFTRDSVAPIIRAMEGIAPKIPPNLFMPKLPPNFFGPTIPPNLFKEIAPKIPLNLFKDIVPKIPPEVLKGMTPIVPPDFFKNMPTISPDVLRNIQRLISDVPFPADGADASDDDGDDDDGSNTPDDEEPPESDGEAAKDT